MSTMLVLWKIGQLSVVQIIKRDISQVVYVEARTSVQREWSQQCAVDGEVFGMGLGQACGVAQVQVSEVQGDGVIIGNVRQFRGKV